MPRQSRLDEVAGDESVRCPRDEARCKERGYSDDYVGAACCLAAVAAMFCLVCLLFVAYQVWGRN